MQLENINLNTAYNLVVQDAMVKNYKEKISLALHKGGKFQVAPT